MTKMVMIMIMFVLLYGSAICLFEIKALCIEMKEISLNFMYLTKMPQYSYFLQTWRFWN